MDVEHKLAEVHESDQSFEEFFHELFDPVVKDGPWELEYIDSDYDDLVDGLGEMYQLAFDAKKESISEEERKEREEKLPEEGADLLESDFSYGEMIMKWNFNSRGNLIRGTLWYQLPRYLDGEQVGEPGELLFELREACERITERHETEYLTREEDLHYPDISEVIFKIHVPPDYDQELYQDMVDSVTATAEEIEKMHQGIIDFVSEYSYQ